MGLSSDHVRSVEIGQLALAQAEGGQGSAPCVLAFGNFDGLHVGHRAIVGLLRAEAARLGGHQVALVTFDPHPLTLLRPELAPTAIEPLATRVRRMHGAGVDRVVVLRFDEALRATSADAFGAQLFDVLGARAVVVSADSRFGAGGAGTAETLRRLAAARGARVVQIPAVFRDGRPVSSSRVRRAVEQGDVVEAARLLERPFCLHGRVVPGDRRGRELGFPTANLDVGGQVRPAAGVYAGWLEVEGAMWRAVANLGVRPTVDGQQWRVEAHVLDWSGDLYGKPVGLHLTARLRAEQRFAGLAELRAAIADDAARASTALAADVMRGLRPLPSP